MRTTNPDSALSGEIGPALEVLPFDKTMAAVPSTDPLYGVHGWLFVVVLMFRYLGPIIITIGLLGRFMQLLILLQESASIPSGPIAAIALQSFVQILICTGAIKVGNMLEDLNPAGPSRAKVFLIFILVWNFVNTLVLQTMINPPDGNGIDYRMISLIWAIIQTITCYAYLSISKRVKVTYGAAH